MQRILAIETDPKRRQALTTLVHEHLAASLVVVASGRAAIASIEERTPDLIIASTLLSPSDEAELLTHMKGLESAPYIQMLTVPALDMLVDTPAEAHRWGIFGPVFNRHPVSQGLQYDPGVIAAEIADGLAHARAMRLEYASTLALSEVMNRRAQETSLVPTSPGSRELPEPSSVRVEQHLRDCAREERRVALRKGRGDVPWLSGIKVSWGPELELINISSTGVLVETGLKFAPGSSTNLQLCGPEPNLVVPVRFIRSDIARIDGLGVRYRAAATFAKEVDIDGRGAWLGREGGTPARPSEELAALFGAVLSSTRDEPAHARFAQGLRRLVGARDVRVSFGPPESPARRGTLYFDVPGDDRCRSTLQVIFDRNHDVTDVEFRVLKAAAWLTAAVLEFEPEKTVSPAAEHAGALALIAGRVA